MAEGLEILSLSEIWLFEILMYSPRVQKAGGKRCCSKGLVSVLVRSVRLVCCTPVLVF